MATLRGSLLSVAYAAQGMPVPSLWRGYEERQWWPRERIKEHKVAALREILRHARRSVPHYRAQGLPEQLEAFPVLTRETVLSQVRALYAEGASSRGALDITTSGSTGKRVDVKVDRFDRAQRSACAWRGDSATGLIPWAPTAVLWGGEYFKASFPRNLAQSLAGLLLDQRVLDSYSGEASKLNARVELLRRWRPQRIVGYSSSLFNLALHMQRADLQPLQTRMLISSAMHIDPQQKELAECMLGAPLQERYGCQECGPIAFQCSAGRWHLNSDLLHLEVLRTDGSIGGHGRGSLLVTVLYNRLMPLIRYEVGDVVDIPEEGACPCGRGLPVMDSLVGRIYEQYIAPDGSLVNWFGMNRAAIGMPLLAWQVIDEENGTLRYLIVTGESFSSAELDLIKRRLREMLPHSIGIEIEQVEKLHTTPEGKRIRLLRRSEIDKALVPRAR